MKRHPDVETAEVIEKLVYEDERLLFLGYVERIRDDFRVGMFGMDPADQRLEAREVSLFFRLLVIALRGSAIIRRELATT